MAEEIALDIKIQNAEAAKSLGEMRKALKELVSEQQNVGAGSAEFKKLAKAINDAEGKIGDLNDGFKTLSGSGVERVSSSVGLLKEGFTSFDTGKIATGFKGLGAAMSAIPIFLLVEGLKLLWENFDVVVNVAKSFTAEAKEQEKAVRALSQAQGELAGNLDEIAFREKEAIRNSDVRTRLAIENAKQQGATEKELNEIQIKGNEEKLKKIKWAEDNYREQKLFADSEYIKALKSGDEETIKAALENLNKADALLRTSIDKRKAFQDEMLLYTETKETEAYNKRKEAYDKFINEKLESDKRYAEQKKKLEDDINAAADAQSQAYFGKQQEIKDKELADQQAQDQLNWDRNQLNLENDRLRAEESKKITKEEEEAKRAEKQKTFDSTIQGTKQGLQAAQALTDLYFAYQLRKNKGNAQAELEIRKKQFNVNKAFGVANAVVDGVGAVQKALNNPYPLNIVLAVLSGVLAAANVAKIASAKFDDGGGASAGGGDIGNVGTPQAPVVPQPNNTVTKISDEGKVEGQAKQGEQKVILVETDVTKSQKRVDMAETAAKIG